MAGVLALPLPEHDERVAAVPQPASWDVFAVSTYASISIIFWYYRNDSRFGHCADRADDAAAKYFYEDAVAGWRGSDSALDSLRVGFPAAGGSFQRL